jgi:ABC-type phosphate transport system substrate-binding protein
MSFSLTPRRGTSIAAGGVVALLLMALAAIGLAPRAEAAFSLSKCGGVEITGRGASFARDAHKLFNGFFKTSFCPGSGLSVSYEPLGSGAGREAVKNRALPPRFGMTDEAPNATETLRIEKGVPASGDPNDPLNPFVINTEDDGKIHIVPAAVGAVAALVNLPNGCTQEKINAIPTSAAQPVSRTDEEDKNGDTIPDGVVRLRFSKDVYEEIWAQGATTPGEEVETLEWGEVVEAFDGVAGCGDKQIIRVVRFDESGTSFAFKDYLNSILSARKWKTDFSTIGPGLTRNWPGATFGDRDDCDDAPNGIADPSDPDGPGAPGLAVDTDNLTSACAGNAAELVAKLKATDGSIGYADIATARSAGLDVTARTASSGTGSAFDNDTYWSQVENGSNVYTEPTTSQFGFRVDGEPGANCTATTFVEKGASTLASWFNTSGVNSAAGYGICSLTYGLVFDDSAEIWGNTPPEQAKARTVKDYWTALLSDSAQVQLPLNDYAPLPEDIQAIAKAGIASVSWDKAGGGQEPGEGDGGGDDDKKGDTTPPPPPPPSNLFSLPKKSISSKTGQATVSVKIPGPGKVELVGTANVPSANSSRVHKKKITVGKVVLTAGKAGTYNLTLKPSAAAKKRLREKGKLQVSLKVTYTPTGGTAKTSNSSVTLKLGTKKGK